MTTARELMKKTLISWLIGAMALGPAAPAALAASADFSNVPLPSKKRPNPNMIFAIDDSGSMDFEIAVNGNDGSLWFQTGDGRFHGRKMDDTSDFVTTGYGGTGTINFNATGALSDTWKKYSYLFPNGTGSSATSDQRSLADGNDSHFAIAPTEQFGWTRSSAYNKQYYNPAITYAPWRPYNPPSGSACNSGTATGSGSTFLCTPGNANKDAARSHPVYGSTTVDVDANVAANQNTNFRFRMYAGMIVPNGATYRLCSGDGDGENCGSWQSAVTENRCLTKSSGGINVTDCAPRAMGMSIGSNLSMGSNDHAEVAIQYYPATYYVADASVATPDAYGPDGQKLRRVTIASGNAPFPKATTRSDCAGADCTYAEEIQNFANWYQYYRKRTLSLNAALGNALDAIVSLRGGYFVFNNNPSATYHTNRTSTTTTMFDFDSTDTSLNDRRLLGHLYSVHPSGGTPTREVVKNLGNRFKVTGASAPIQAVCQFNAGFVITDGFANDSAQSLTPSNYDAQTPGVKGPIGVGYTDPSTGSPLTQRAGDAYYFNQQMGTTSALPDPTGGGLVNPYKDNWSNTMADWGMYYYSSNLRPDLQTGRVPVDYNNTSPDADLNPNLHMNTYGLVLGLGGRIFANSAFPNENQNPYTTAPNWNLINPTTITSDPSAIDELWHATINGRGSMLKADSPEETRNSVLEVVNKVVAKGGAAAAVSVSNAIPVAGDNFLYQTSYNSGVWAGDLNAYSIDLFSGALSSTPAWTLSAQKQLADRPWTNRVIVSYDPSSAGGIPFQWANLNATQQAGLTGLTVGSVAIQGSWVVDWLRGDRSREGALLRSRGPRKSPDPVTGTWPTEGNIVPSGISILGDLANAEPVYVREPRFNYFDAGYAAFKSTPAVLNRTRVLYTAGNDGMVHVFDGATGAEKWAYVPSFGFKAQTGFTSSGLRNLADKEFFSHRFLVDATPVAGDLDAAKAGGRNNATPADGSSWMTMVVGGLGKGGRGYYAIDATNPDAGDETAAATKVKWEFPNPSTSTTDTNNMGYTFGRPLIVKTKALGWVVLATSGYENGNETGGDGRGHVFVLDPLNGAVLADLTTVDVDDGAASATDRTANPRGLAYISAFASSPNDDATIDYVYGGDLYGNVWRFDLSGAAKTDWNVKLLATLRDASNARQPITTEPELGVVQGKRIVYVGTGRYFNDKDIPGATGAFYSATGTQSLYALKDNQTTTPTITNVRSNLTQQTVTKSGTTATITSNAVDLNTKQGWFLDFPDTGERVVTNPVLAAGVLAITTNIPDGADPCLPGGRSWLYAIDYRTGSYIPGSTYAGKYLGEALASRVNMIRVGSGIKGIIRTSAGGTKVEEAPGRSPGATPKRKAWHEIVR